MTIISAFENWSRKFINNAEDLDGTANHSELLCRVLTTVDEAYFSALSNKQPNADEIEEKTCEYLRKFLQTNKRPTLEANTEMDMMSEGELEYLFSLVFELCLRIDQPATIQHIVQLSNIDQ